MLRKFIEIIFVILCFIIQTSLFPYLDIAGVTPNLLVVLVASIGFMRGKNEGIFIGFISGLLIDLFFSNVIGFYALIYSVIGFLNGFFTKEFMPEDIKLPVVLIVGSDFVLNLFVYFITFMFRGDFNFYFYLVKIIVPEIVYTLLISIFLYLLILKVNKKLEEHEKRSASKFG